MAGRQVIIRTYQEQGNLNRLQVAEVIGESGKDLTVRVNGRTLVVKASAVQESTHRKAGQAVGGKAVVPQQYSQAAGALGNR